MPNSVAEAYLLILRPSFVPVVGEAVPVPFNEQIEIDEWNWSLENEDYVARSAARDKARQAVKDARKDTDSGPKKEVNADAARKLAKLVSDVQLDKDKKRTPAEKEKKIRELMTGLTRQVEADDKAEAAQEKKEKKASGDDDDDQDDKLQFTFKKNVDAATTQLLNSLKAGDNMPKAVLTLFHRSKNAPVTLVVTFGNVRLKHYEISVDPTETMADLKESWTASYETVDYLYQNRPAASGPNGITKGTARVFKKK